MSDVWVHPKAYIHPNAKLGAGVRVEAFAFIAEDVEIGEGTYIGPHAVIYDGARIGKHCKIFPGAVISAIPQDLKFNGEYTLTVIGDYTTIREYATVNRGTIYNGETRIGNHVLLMAYVHVAHDCIIEDHVILANAVNLAGHIRVEEFAIIGGMSAVHQFCRIGKHAMVAGVSKVRKDVPPYVLAGHDPLSYAGVNVVGLRRRGFSQEAIEEIHQLYDILYFSQLPRQKAIEKMQEAFPNSTYKDEILRFIQQSERGIIQKRRTNEDRQVNTMPLFSELENLGEQEGN